VGEFPSKANQWKPGESGNPAGPTPRRPIQSALRKLMDDGIGGKDVMEAMARVAVQKALKGDHRFWAEIRDMIDGPLRQELTAIIEAPKVIRLKDRPEEGEDNT
jgi:hypothetical protein